MKVILAVSVLVFLCLVFGSIFWYKFNLKSVSADNQKQTIQIAPGETTSSVLKSLKSKKLIRSEIAAKIYLKLSQKESYFKPGVYYLSPDLNLSAIVAEIVKGPKDIKITFPEGWRREQYAARLKSIFPDFNTDEFLALSATLEGRLFPDTYYLPITVTPQKAITIFTSNFQKRTQLDLSNSKTLILASLIERESNNPEDSKIIAGILLKRLENNWPLQIDATVQFAKDSQKCKLQTLNCDYWKPIFDTKFESPFNTYINPGLPPAPISNPGLISIQAVQSPKNSEYWFYLTGNDGKTYFSADLNSHQELIDTYLKP